MISNPFQALFLDRDGVINEEDGIVRTIDQLKLIPGSAEAIGRLNQLGVLAIVVTNQPVVARGWCSEAELAVIHRHLEELLLSGGAKLDAIYFCPHHENANDQRYRVSCDCRKPKPGLLLQAGRDFDLELSRCAMVGDRTVDIKAAREAGGTGLVGRNGIWRSGR